jgi:hypothetical protein
MGKSSKLNTFRCSIMKTWLETDPQWTAEFVHSIPCECGKSYIGQTGRPLALWLSEHRHNLKQGSSREIKISLYAYDEGHTVGRNESRHLEAYVARTQSKFPTRPTSSKPYIARSDYTYVIGQ